MTVPLPDGSRDRRIEGPTNLWFIHPAARALLPRTVALGIPANAVSCAGLALGIGAAACYYHWPSRASVLLGFALSIGWLIADGLDGMVARATGTSSAFGRFLDGIVDHGVFVLIYVAMATRIGTGEGWVLALSAGALHIAQSSLYEGERARFHRRLRGVAAPGVPRRTGMALVRAYDWLAGMPDRLGQRFESQFARAADPHALGRRYGLRAVPAMRLQSLLSANMRVALIALACLAGNPRLFWWAEIVPLTLIAAAGLVWHRRVERAFTPASPSIGDASVATTISTREHS